MSFNYYSFKFNTYDHYPVHLVFIRIYFFEETAEIFLLTEVKDANSKNIRWLT